MRKIKNIMSTIKVNVLSLERLKSILHSGFIYKDNRIIKPCVCMTRDSNYLMNRGIRMVFDYHKLRYNYKVNPFCLKGFLLIK